MNYVKTLLKSRLRYYEDELRIATLDGDLELSKQYTEIVLEIKKAYEILVDAGAF